VLSFTFFLSWQQLVVLAGLDNVGNFSFWLRRNSREPPMFLCDSDMQQNAPVSSIVGLAFVFHEKENVIRQLVGIQNTYCVSSIYLLDSKTISHCRSFFSFPSTHHAMLPSCFPSMVFEQLTRLHYKMQTALNTKAMRAKSVTCIQLDNISQFTWDYMTIDLAASGIEVTNSYAVVKASFMEKDSLTVQKWREQQQSFSNFTGAFVCR
jgi:hypothetical protein